MWLVRTCRIPMRGISDRKKGAILSVSRLINNIAGTKKILTAGNEYVCYLDVKR